MSGYTNVERRELRALAEEAYRRELNAELEKLYERFQLWAQDAADSFLLCDEIHEFHQGASRELFKRYRDEDPSMAVAFALSRGFLEKSGVSEELLAKLASWIGYFSR